MHQPTLRLLALALLFENGTSRLRMVENDNSPDEGMPAHWSAAKKAEIRKALEAEAFERARRAQKGL